MLSTVRRSLRRRTLKAARLAALLRERTRSQGPPVLELEAVRRRLEILLAALYGRAIPVAPLADPPRDLASRVIRAITAGASRAPALATNDGETVRLPRRLDARGGEAAAMTEYQLLALEQAERVARGTVAALPGDATAVERDLFLVAEGRAVDAALLARLPRFAGALRAARARMLSRRPRPETLPLLDRDVEGLARAALSEDEGDHSIPLADAPADSLRWARETAPRLAGSADRYAGLDPIALWGARGVALGMETPIEQTMTFELGRRMGIRITTKGGEEARPGEVQQDHVGVSRTALLDPRRATEDARGLVGVRASGGGDASDGSGSSDAGAAPVLAGSATAPAGAIWYREWDCYARRYRPQAAAVVEPAPREADDEWAVRALRAHAALVREVKHRFGKLRAQRARLHQRRGGDELDLDAVVAATTDLRAGRSPDDRLYLEVRPARRGLAIALLVDVSGSTDAPVTDARQIIDVEKDAMLFASEALDALGDRYAVLAFSGRGAEQVRVTTVKGFAEPDGAAVRRRMAGLTPDANTRLGAAVRHAAALLAREPAGHRLLLILSDGKPNDVGHYQGEYAVEDTRQAVLEARASGIYPYCLAVDREEPEYLARIFGEAGHTILRAPDQLPAALLRAVRQLLGGGR